ncbi:NADH-quinone oxidoreductase subunit C [Candidatus Woesearchaeota archaeon]|nr:NADH-quinone oxidoreductase subunit C [Candidatus Woesearchaeota archaeon]
MSGGCNNEVFIRVKEDDVEKAASMLSKADFVLIAMFCEEGFQNKGKFSIFYVFEKKSYNKILVLVRDISSNNISSVTGIFPAAFWYEREIMDGFGINFNGNPDKRRLFLHEWYQNEFHPLLKSFKNRKIENIGPRKIEFKKEMEENTGNDYEFKEMKGDGVYQIPVGPIHAGIIEPGHFRFSVIGEVIYNLEIRMFYKHRGIEKFAEEKKAEDAIAIAESISGDESVANSTAFCTAVEKIYMADVPKRALHLRTILLELERIYSHLGDLAGMIIDVGFPAGASQFFILREEILRMNNKLTGSRFMKNILTIGGLKKEVKNDALIRANHYFNKFLGEFHKAVKVVHTTASVIDRLETTGIIRKDLIKCLNITGPAARGSGAAIDTRIDHPYGIYGKIMQAPKIRYAGDVLSRFEVKTEETIESVKMIQNLINTVPEGNVNAEYTPKDGFGLCILEAPRGQSIHWVDIKDGKIYRYKIRTASFCNWQAIEHAVLGNIVPDFPLINKSLNLSYAGTDL